MNIRQHNGHVMISSGTPVYSKREYIVRRFERNPFDAPQQDSNSPRMHIPKPGQNRIEPAIVFEDKETGLLTTDVAKFEAWLYPDPKEDFR